MTAEGLAMQMLELRKLFAWRLGVKQGVYGVMSPRSADDVQLGFLTAERSSGIFTYDATTTFNLPSRPSTPVFVLAGIPVYEDPMIPDGIIEIRNEDYVLNYDEVDRIQVQQVWHFRVQVLIP